MVASHFAKANIIFNDVSDYLPPGIILTLAAGLVENRKYWEVYKKELIGTVLMVVFTFSAGKWVGVNSLEVAWACHACGVVAADYFGGGQHVNPAVTVSMFALNKCSYTEAFVRVAGQMAGGMVAFPLFHAVADAFGLTPFGGPEFSIEENGEAALSEFLAMFLLCWVIYILNWEMNFGKNHYWIKQFLTAFAIRALIEYFPTAGPAMNPMLGTTWHSWGVDQRFEFPKENEHYFVYWVAPSVSAILASVTYAIWNGDRVFGQKMPGPIRKVKKS